MNQGPNAMTAAAAIAVLTAPHPIAAYTQPITHSRDPTTAYSYILLSSIASVTVASHLNSSPPRPEQGGQHISLYWLQSLSEEDCLWHFRLVYVNLEKLDRELMTQVEQIHS
jgi:hypothetical protein